MQATGGRISTTARWPERLHHVATLLRAEAAAVVTLTADGARAVFAYRIDPETDWRALLGAAVVERASRSSVPVTTALPAGRWDDHSAFALLVRLDTLATPALLCVLRHAVPFDPIEVQSGESAAVLLGIGLPESRAAEAPDARRVAATIARLEREEARVGDAPIRVLVAEGQPATRLGLRRLLAEAGLTVVADCATLAEAMAMLPDVRADVALMDLGLSDAPGPGAITRLAAAAPAVPIVAFGDGALARAALAAGARGFLRKDAPPERVVAALRGATTGLITFGIADAALVRAPSERDASAAPPPTLSLAHSKEHLTARELDLLRYLAQGYTNKEIARAMALAEDTVKKAVQTVIAKLGATDRTHAVVIALRTALIE